MVFGFVGAFIGLTIGFAVGIWGGSKLLANFFPDLDVQRFDIRADYDQKVPIPVTKGKPVPRKYRAFLKYFPNWATMPDFYRVTWMNHILKTLWPHFNQAIGKMVLETINPQLESITKQYPFIEAIDIELIDFGTKPIRVAGVKVYDSADDEVIMECPLTWGSNARIRVSMRIRVSNWSFYVPIQISDFQMKVMSRSTLKPLVDTLPCMGAVNITLLEAPHLDFTLNLFSKFDWMHLPGIRELAIFVIQGVVGDMLQYPNAMTFDIMEGGGIPPPPVGLLQVKICKAEGISAGGDLLSKVDPYVELCVRDDRSQRTKTVWNSKHPTFNEVFNLIVDDIDTQTLTLKLHDDDLGFKDPVLGVIEHDLCDADFISKPRERVSLSMDFISLPALKKIKRLVKKRSEQERKPQKLPTAGKDEQGRKQYKIPDAPEVIGHDKERQEKAKVGTVVFEAIYVPFRDAAADDSSANHDKGSEDASLDGTNSFSKITEDDKGILTVALTGCTNLESSDKDVDPYVVFTLTDPAKVKPEVQQSSKMNNEPNPHWNQKFDFALISATSVLSIQVYDKKTTMQALLSNPMKAVAGKITGKPAEADECIGTLRLKIKDVVRNERIRDSWALQETQKGDIQLTLSWKPVAIDGFDDLDEAGDQREVEQLKQQQEQDKAKDEQKDGGAATEKSSRHHHLHLPHINMHHRREKEKVEYEGE